MAGSCRQLTQEYSGQGFSAIFTHGPTVLHSIVDDVEGEGGWEQQAEHTGMCHIVWIGGCTLIHTKLFGTVYGSTVC
jgi:uncharacterized protein YcaQ